MSEGMSYIRLQSVENDIIFFFKLFAYIPKGANILVPFLGNRLVTL